MSQDYPAQFGRSLLYRDPQGTLPMPSPQDIPRPQWFSQWMKFRWQLIDTIQPDEQEPQPPGFVFRCTWTSPAFDLRPDLRSGNAGTKDGVPIWSTAARMYVQVARDAQGTASQPVLRLDNITVSGTDWVNTTFNRSSDRRLGEGITGGGGLLQEETKDVSSKFAAPSPARTALVGFSPPGTDLGGGDGYPVRFWRLELAFTSFVETGAPLPPDPPEPPPLVLQASVY